MSSPSASRGRAARRWMARGALSCLAALAAACGQGGEPEPLPLPGSTTCAESTLTYQNFAAPFTISWCRGCHAEGQPKDMRQRAPLGVDFDTAAQVRAAGERILARATGVTPTMPPAGGPSDEERALLAEWIACGMK